MIVLENINTRYIKDAIPCFLNFVINNFNKPLYFNFTKKDFVPSG